MSAAAGFAQGFADTFTKRMEQRRAEQERIREETRAEERLAKQLDEAFERQKSLLGLQAEQEYRTWEQKQRAELGIPGGLLPGQEGPLQPFSISDAKLQAELAKTRAVGEAETDIAVNRQRQVGDIETQQRIAAAKGVAGVEDPLLEYTKAQKRMEIIAGANKLAKDRVDVAVAAAPEPLGESEIARLWGEELAKIEEAGKFQDLGISLIKPVTSEITETAYLDAVTRAVDAKQAREDLLGNRNEPGLAGAAGAPPPSERVITFFYNKFGEPLYKQGTGLPEGPLFGPEATAGSQLGAVARSYARGMGVDPMAFGYGAYQESNVTEMFMNGTIDIQQWLESIGAATAEPTPGAPSAPVGEEPGLAR